MVYWSRSASFPGLFSTPPPLPHPIIHSEYPPFATRGDWKLETIRTRATCMYFLSTLALIISGVPVQTANFIFVILYSLSWINRSGNRRKKKLNQEWLLYYSAWAMTNRARNELISKSVNYPAFLCFRIGRKKTTVLGVVVACIASIIAVLFQRDLKNTGNPTKSQPIPPLAFRVL